MWSDALPENCFFTPSRSKAQRIAGSVFWRQRSNYEPIAVARDDLAVDEAVALAHELVALQPDIILAGGSTVTVALQRETPTIPIVYVGADPVPTGIVRRLDRGGEPADSG